MINGMIKITVWIFLLQDILLKPVQPMDNKLKVLQHMFYN